MLEKLVATTPGIFLSNLLFKILRVWKDFSSNIVLSKLKARRLRNLALVVCISPIIIFEGTPLLERVIGTDYLWFATICFASFIALIILVLDILEWGELKQRISAFGVIISFGMMFSSELAMLDLKLDMRLASTFVKGHEMSLSRTFKEQENQNALILAQNDTILNLQEKISALDALVEQLETRQTLVISQ